MKRGSQIEASSPKDNTNQNEYDRSLVARLTNSPNLRAEIKSLFRMGEEGRDTLLRVIRSPDSSYELVRSIADYNLFDSGSPNREILYAAADRLWPFTRQLLREVGVDRVLRETRIR